HDIPVHSEGRSGFFEASEVRDVLALLHVLDNQRQDVPLAALLRSPIAAIPHPEDALARIVLAYRADSEPAPPAAGEAPLCPPRGEEASRAARDGAPEPVSFHEAVVRYAREHDDELAARLRDFLSGLGEWRLMAHQRPLAEVLWHIYDTTGYLAFCSGLEDGPQRRANLLYLHGRAKQFGTFQRQDLARFLRFLEGLHNDSDLGEASLLSEADDVVRIMSVHRSKGLEFPVVVLPDAGKKINLNDCYGPVLVDRQAYLGLSVCDETRRVCYPSLAHLLVQSRLRQQGLAEELRVLYVAMTRAKEHLILVGTCPEKAPAKWASLHGTHRGPLPADVILGGNSLLDWLGPAAASAPAEDGAREHVRIIPHDAAEIASWSTSAGDAKSKLNDEQKRLAMLEPLAPPPPRDMVADEVIARVRYAYPYRTFTHVAATESVTRLAKGQAAAWEPLPALADSASLDRILKRPRCLGATTAPAATDVGTATHIALQHLDFAQADDERRIREQVDELVARRLLDSELAGSVDVGAIHWFMDSPLGRLMCRHADDLRREQSVYYALGVPRASPDPLDAVMLRGRIDVLVPTTEGLLIVDYKTDRVTAPDVARRADTYRGQMSLYRQAVTHVTGRTVAACHLVFLSPRQIVTA
ncbi:MAG: UvrD-helicase domain-containing protein, partial [Tepidisphaeraceae bacterium]